MQTNKPNRRSTETPNHRSTELPKHRPLFHSVVCAAAISVAFLFHHAALAALSTNDTTKASSKLLPVADFEKGRLITVSEVAWIPFTDAVLAGKSSINPSITNSGAAGSKAAMQLTGKLTADFQWGGFAGVTARLLINGGSTNLSHFTGIQFHARGDGKPCRVVIGKENVKDNNHFFAEFRAKPEWALIKVSFTELAQSPFFGTQVTWSADNINSVAFMAIAQPEETREFNLQVDNISFY